MRYLPNLLNHLFRNFQRGNPGKENAFVRYTATLLLFPTEIAQVNNSLLSALLTEIYENCFRPQLDQADCLGDQISARLGFTQP